LHSNETDIIFRFHQEAIADRAVLATPRLVNIEVPMSWLVFSYSLPSQAHSSPRVALWRRLRRLGALSPTGGIHILPAQDDCVEAFQWLAQEVKQAKGEALVMRVERFEGLEDPQLMALFREARGVEYADIEAEAERLEKRLGARMKAEDRSRLREALDKLRKRYADIARVDFFEAPEGTSVAARLARLETALSPREAAAVSVSPAAIEAYRDRRWVTRPRPHVDRLACIWLIRRFIDPHAVVRYSLTPDPDEVAFDMREGEFGHRGNLCTFETMLSAFGLDEPGLRSMAEIVHEIDLRDGRYAHPETTGVDAILRGWLLARLSDAELEAHGPALFEGLYSALSRRHKETGRARKR
jgi:hypothetical protein